MGVDEKVSLLRITISPRIINQPSRLPPQRSVHPSLFITRTDLHHDGNCNGAEGPILDV